MPETQDSPSTPDLPFASEEAVRNYVDRIAHLAEQYEFHTFSIGTLLKIDLPPDDATAVKRDLNRRVAVGVFERLPDRYPQPGGADVIFTLQHPGHWVEVKPQPLYVYGRYMKYSRDLPQARWICKRCRGKGCRQCDGTGKVFEVSVEEIIAAPLLEAFEAEESKMHATGRQDVNVRMLGTGRPFAIELVNPRRRTADISALQEKINAADERVAVAQLREVDRRLVKKLDTVRAEKTYRAVVRCEKSVGASAVEKLGALAGMTIHQRTPQRVEHRRADKVRERRIISATLRLPDADAVTTFELYLRTESGAYIKELISGDDERTQPSVASLLGVPCICEELDVLGVHYDPLATDAGA